MKQFLVEAWLAFSFLERGDSSEGNLFDLFSAMPLGIPRGISYIHFVKGVWLVGRSGLGMLGISSSGP